MMQLMCQFVLQCKQEPGTFKQQAETMGFRETPVFDVTDKLRNEPTDGPCGRRDLGIDHNGRVGIQLCLQPRAVIIHFPSKCI